MTAVIEELTGRRVQAFMSTSHQDPDPQAELFLLEPEASDAASEAVDDLAG